MVDEVDQIFREHCQRRARGILARVTGIIDSDLDASFPDFVHVAKNFIGAHTLGDGLSSAGGNDADALAIMRDLTAKAYEKRRATERRARAATTAHLHPEAFQALTFAYLDQCISGRPEKPWPRHHEKLAGRAAIDACTFVDDPERTALLHRELTNMTRPQRALARAIAFEARFPVQSAAARTTKRIKLTT
jgi:hypothetical protein